MLKRLVIILILLNIFPFVYHKHFIGVHSAQAGDFLASEGWDEGGGGDGGDGGDDGDDGDDDDDDNCTDPGSTTSENQINTYISNGQEWATYEVTSTDNCTGETSSYTYEQLVDDCSDPSYISETDSDPHDYYLSGNTVYAKITHTTSNSCNNLSTSYDTDEEQQDVTDGFNEAINNTNQEASGATLTNETISIETGEGDGVTKPNNPKWQILTGYGYWGLYSKETGVVKFVTDTNHDWAWVSLTHTSISLQGSVLPGVEVSYTQGEGTPSFTAETAAQHFVFYGGMSIDFDVTYKPICEVCGKIPILGQAMRPITKTYHNTSTLWDATPSNN